MSSLPLAMISLAALSLPTAALALSCPSGPQRVFPQDSASEVPTNVVIRVSYSGALMADSPFSLYDQEDQEVPIEIDLASEGGAGTVVYALTPAELLSAQASYTLVLHGEVEVVPDTTVSSFTTGDGPLLEGPPAPQVIDTTRRVRRDQWGTWRRQSLIVERPDAPTFYEVDVAMDEDFSEIRTVQVPSRGVDEATEVRVDHGLCTGSLNLDRQERWMRARAIDLAGNMSSTSEGARAGGCSTLHGPLTPWGLALGLGVLLLRRARGGS